MVQRNLMELHKFVIPLKQQPLYNHKSKYAISSELKYCLTNTTNIQK